MDSALQIRGARGGQSSRPLDKFFFRPFRPQFGLKIRWKGPPGPSPGSPTEVHLNFIKNQRFGLYLPMVVIGETNSSCFILNKIEVFPAPSSPSTTSRISIFGPIWTLLSFVKATGMAASVSHRLAMLVNCSCCSCTVSRRLWILFLASITWKYIFGNKILMYSGYTSATSCS